MSTHKSRVRLGFITKLARKVNSLLGWIHAQKGRSKVFMGRSDEVANDD